MVPSIIDIIMEVKLVYFSFHDDHEQKMALALFLVTTSLLLKLANHAMHGGETLYTCVFERFHDNR